MAPSKSKSGAQQSSGSEADGVMAMLQKISNQVGELKAHQKKTDAEIGKLKDKVAADALVTPNGKGSGAGRQSSTSSTASTAAETAKTPSTAKTPAEKI